MGHLGRQSPQLVKELRMAAAGVEADAEEAGF